MRESVVDIVKRIQTTEMPNIELLSKIHPNIVCLAENNQLPIDFSRRPY